MNMTPNLHATGSVGRKLAGRAQWFPGAEGIAAHSAHNLPSFRLALFVDSESGLGYSGVLARCCAWGLCVRALNDRFYFVGAFIRIQLVSP